MSSLEFIGRLHPLLVHLPIGILLFGAGLLLVQRVQKIDVEVAISWAFLIGGITATMASIAGYILAQSGEYEADLVNRHQWAGIATAVLGFATYFLKNYRSILVWVLLITLSLAGHWGGVLTHGEDYLFASEKTETVQEQITNQQLDSSAIADNTDKKATVKSIIFYEDKVVPILKKKCYNCHSATKKKGGLRLDGEQFIRKGGKNGKVIVPHQPMQSHLFEYLVLPLNHDNHMPPKGKPQLTKQEIAIIQTWIKSGASFSETITQPIVENVTLPLQEVEIDNNQSIENQKVETNSESQKFTPADEKVLADLRQKNIVITAINISPLRVERYPELASGRDRVRSSALSANFVNVSSYDSQLLDDLKAVENQLVGLRLTNQPISDNDILKIATFKNLTKLNIENTKITNTALSHLKNLPNLQQLNLYGTAITDEGLKHLHNHKNLKVIYLWKTNVTNKGVTDLQKALPKLKIEVGDLKFAKHDSI